MTYFISYSYKIATSQPHALIKTDISDIQNGNTVISCIPCQIPKRENDIRNIELRIQEEVDAKLTMNKKPYNQRSCDVVILNIKEL